MLDLLTQVEEEEEGGGGKKEEEEEEEEEVVEEGPTPQRPVIKGPAMPDAALLAQVRLYTHPPTHPPSYPPTHPPTYPYRRRN